ncbi:MAG: aminomethyl transferase family protein, partial [Gammaproteobacteria bacterium]|nr:aminomethyl transferase family protein [Gammaproteobacteria bacterium]
HLMQAGEEFGLIYSSLRSMQIRRVEAGILDYGTDMDRTMTPFQAGLGKFVDLSKSDFIGKLALAGADPRPLLYGIKCLAGAPSYRAQVVWQGRAVGHIRSTAWSPFLECGIGYVFFAEPGDWLGRRVTVLTKGSEFDGTVVSLPFYDADKRIPRGLDTMRP